MSENKIGYKDILRQKEFMKTVVADLINRFGDSVDTIAFVWLVYQVTGSAAWSAIIFGVNKIPTVFLQPFAGAAIEGKNKKLIMVVTDIIRGVCVGFIATAFMLGFLNQWILLAETVVISCAEAFRLPASSAIIPKLLDKKYYEFGISLNKSANSVMELIGIGLAGTIIGAFSISAAIYTDMATFFISALILLTLRIKEEKLEKVKMDVKAYLASLKGGFAYLKENALLRYFVILAVFLNGVLVPFNSLMAPLVSEVLHSGEMMLSVLGAAISIGLIIGAVLYPYISRRISSRAIVILGGYSIGITYFAFLAVGIWITSVVLIYATVSLAAFYLGLSIALLSSMFSVEFMKNVKEEYLARCSAILGAASMAAMPVVSFIVSAVAGVASTAVLYIAAGALDFIICIYLCRKKIFIAMGVKNIGGYNEEVENSEAG